MHGAEAKNLLVAGSYTIMFETPWRLRVSGSVELPDYAQANMV